MTDRYANFADLAAASEIDVDYRIRLADRGSPVVILAPHGGTIEPETARIAEAVAAPDFSFYAFEALREGAHGDFHITSHLFDEPQALEIVSKASIAVAIHGRRDNGTDSVWLGGRAAGLRDRIGQSLKTRGFDAERNARLPGEHLTNICNRTRTGEGVQIELSRSFRRKLAEDRSLLDAFRHALREPIERQAVAAPPPET